VRVDRRVLNLDMERQQVNSSDQQRLEVDAYARFRIIDPVLMVRTAGTPSAFRNSSAHPDQRAASGAGVLRSSRC
jgi:membrane protease subunit HflC